MLFVGTGALAFLVLAASDPVSLRRIRWAKPFIWLAGSGLFVWSCVMVGLRSARWELPRWLHLLGWLLWPVFLLLILYSLLVEIPFKKAYLLRGHPETLVTTGTYALVRHPGVLWFFFFMCFLFLATGARLYLVALPLWVLLDVLHVYFQEKVVLEKVFGGAYRRYQTEVPMLIPTLASFRRCLRTLGS